MYFVAAMLTVLSGLFYAAGHHEIGSFGTDMCRYGGPFCENPIYVLVCFGRRCSRWLMGRVRQRALGRRE
jgi:hypothetical protein